MSISGLVFHHGHLNCQVLAGIVYGVFLSLSSWALYYVAAKTNFFSASIGMFDLNNRQPHLESWCRGTIASPTNQYNLATSGLRGGPLPPDASACAVGHTYNEALCQTTTRIVPTVLQQCMVEQQWMRDSMLRTLIYAQVPHSLCQCCNACLSAGAAICMNQFVKYVRKHLGRHARMTAWHTSAASS